MSPKTLPKVLDQSAEFIAVKGKEDLILAIVVNQMQNLHLPLIDFFFFLPGLYTKISIKSTELLLWKKLLFFKGLYG